MKRLALFFAFSLAALATAWAQPAAFAEKPALVTAIGQSADFEMVKVLLTRGKIPFTAEPLVKAQGLTPAAKTLVLVAGGSSKGLGAAGISIEAESERAKALLARAKELKMKIITVHLGGSARRGPLSDGFIQQCLAASDYAIVVAEGDGDGLFSKTAAERKFELTKVDKISLGGAPLTAAFK